MAGLIVKSPRFLAVRARFEDECAFAKYRGLNPFAAAILAKLTIHIDLGLLHTFFAERAPSAQTLLTIQGSTSVNGIGLTNSLPALTHT